MTRSEVTWDTDALPASKGTAELASGTVDTDDYFIAILWLPDPDTRRGWRMSGVERKKSDAARRHVGFKP